MRNQTTLQQALQEEEEAGEGGESGGGVESVLGAVGNGDTGVVGEGRGAQSLNIEL